jgi:hypothetical protein
MRRYELIGAALCAGVLALWGGRGDAEEFTARLNGFEELGSLPNVTQDPVTGKVTAANPTGAVLSDGTGTASLELDERAGMVHYTLTYSNVGMTPPKTGTVSQAHIHFGKSRDSGGIIVFFCTNMGNAPALTDGAQKCPPNSGTVTGTWKAADVVGPAAQNIAAGNFQGLVDALNSNTAYANIHTTSLPTTTPENAFPAGEIRGQCRSEDRDDEHEKHDNREHK